MKPKPEDVAETFRLAVAYLVKGIEYTLAVAAALIVVFALWKLLGMDRKA